MFETMSGGKGYGILGSTGRNVDVHPVAQNLKTGVLGVCADGNGSIDNAVLEIFSQANISHNLALKPAGVVGVTTIENSGAASDSVGVYGASSNLPGDTLPTYGFLAGRDPTFNERAGVYGESEKQGVTGVTSTDAEFSTGVFGFSKNGGGVGVRGETVTGTAVYGRSFGRGLAGKFIGHVEVTGDIRLTNGDIAENFVSDAEPEPGTVMVLADDGGVRESCRVYDRRVVGVVCGAGAYKPGIVLDKNLENGKCVQLALVGKVFCKVDAQYGAVEIGDLLTTSLTPGHAMKAADRRESFGAVIGKALGSLNSGRGLIPMLIALQ